MAWRQRITLLLLLVVMWISLSGAYSKEPVIFFGALVSIALVLWVVFRMDRAVGRPSPRPELAGFLMRLPRYFTFLITRVISANIRVTQLLLLERVTPFPRLVRMEVGAQTVLGKLVLANSITLTPGTVTLDLRAGEILVHALGPISAGSVVNGEIDREVRRLEGQRGVSANVRPPRPARGSR